MSRMAGARLGPPERVLVKPQLFQNLSLAAGKISTVPIPVATSTPVRWGGGRQRGECAVHVCVSAV